MQKNSISQLSIIWLIETEKPVSIDISQWVPRLHDLCIKGVPKYQNTGIFPDV
jgi:hypothetical protein